MALLRHARILLAALAVWWCASQAPAAAAPAVLGVSFDAVGDATRVVIDLSQAVQYRLFTLANPYRVVLDLPETEWRVERSTVEGRGVVSGMRFGLFRPGNSRVVFDLGRPVHVAHAGFDVDAHGVSSRFVIDLQPVTETAYRPEQTGTLAALLASAVATAPAVTTPAVAAQAVTAPAVAAPAAGAAVGRHRRVAERPVIAIDAGHGGVDPGTIGADGTFEKDVTLGVARVVRDRLLASGRYRVVMTRADDRFIELRQRVERARAAGAKLFVSLHADSSQVASTRGASIYTLSEGASDAEAAALAAKENRSDLIAGVDLSEKPQEVVSILINLAQRETKNESSEFAGLVMDAFARQNVGLLPRTHRFAGFAVLKAPDVPSVLIELGYLSNRQDERLLLSAGYRRRVAEAIVNAVDRFFAERDRLRKS